MKLEKKSEARGEQRSLTKNVYRANSQRNIFPELSLGRKKISPY